MAISLQRCLRTVGGAFISALVSTALANGIGREQASPLFSDASAFGLLAP